MSHQISQPVDMSPEAIEQRLNELSDLYEFWKSIRTVKYIGPAEPKGPQSEQNRPALAKAGLPGESMMES